MSAKQATIKSYLPERNENNETVKSSCELCKAEHKSFRFHDDDICWAAINPTSGVPMVVSKKHRSVPLPEEQQHMLRVLEHIMSTFGHKPGSYNYSDPNTIPDHYHIQGGKNQLKDFNG